MVRDMHSDDPQQLELLEGLSYRACARGSRARSPCRSLRTNRNTGSLPVLCCIRRTARKSTWWKAPVPSKNRWIIKFEGIDDRDASEAANGVVLYGEADDPEDMLEADEWYPKDLIGLEARLAENNMLGLEPGVVVGKVVDVIEVAQWLLKIRLANPVKDADGAVVENSALVPFVDELVPDIDLEEGYLTLDPPGGLIPGL